MPELIPADAVDPGALHAAFVAAFADYVAGPFALSASQWPHFLARQGVVLPLSRVAPGPEGSPHAFAFVAERPPQRRWRLATMGAVPAARGTGSAPALLEDFVARARAAGRHGLELEVFAQNARAVRLYQRHGFAALAALHGHEAAPLGGTARPGPPAVGRDDALVWLQTVEVEGLDLPMQLGAQVLATADGWAARRQGSAQMIHSAPDEGAVLIRSLVDTDPAQRDAEALARALRAEHPGRAITMPPLLPDGLGGDALRRAGFTRQPLHQWWMQRVLA